MNNLFGIRPLIRRSHVITASLVPSRWVSATAIQWDLKKKLPETLVTNAPGWDEEHATESEKDVKADMEPDVDPKTLKRETTEWLEAHIEDDGTIEK
ncbi:hypothetical protein BD770DRAFT_440687 [Pilaira anomala]|nr:hypothetical protein BD770DRAFT_440687 [Pilaira anomala]